MFDFSIFLSDCCSFFLLFLLLHGKLLCMMGVEMAAMQLSGEASITEERVLLFSYTEIYFAFFKIKVGREILWLVAVA